MTGAQRRAGAEPGGWTRRAGAEATKPADPGLRAAGTQPRGSSGTAGAENGDRSQASRLRVWERGTPSPEEQTGKLRGEGA